MLLWKLFYAWTIFVVACCTQNSIKINKHSKEKLYFKPWNRVFLIHDVSSTLSREYNEYKLETSCIKNTLFNGSKYNLPYYVCLYSLSFFIVFEELRRTVAACLIQDWILQYGCNPIHTILFKRFFFPQIFFQAAAHLTGISIPKSRIVK